MTVLQLIEHLQQFPPELEVVTDEHSDYVRLEPESVGVVRLVDKGHYLEHFYSHQYPSQSLPMTKDFLYI
jgi:hypothetical protein